MGMNIGLDGQWFSLGAIHSNLIGGSLCNVHRRTTSYPSKARFDIGLFLYTHVACSYVSKYSNNVNAEIQNIPQ